MDVKALNAGAKKDLNIKISDKFKSFIHYYKHLDYKSLLNTFKKSILKSKVKLKNKLKNFKDPLKLIFSSSIVKKFESLFLKIWGTLLLIFYCWDLCLSHWEKVKVIRYLEMRLYMLNSINLLPIKSLYVWVGAAAILISAAFFLYSLYTIYSKGWDYFQCRAYNLSICALQCHNILCMVLYFLYAILAFYDWENVIISTFRDNMISYLVMPEEHLFDSFDSKDYYLGIRAIIDNPLALKNGKEPLFLTDPLSKYQYLLCLYFSPLPALIIPIIYIYFLYELKRIMGTELLRRRFKLSPFYMLLLKNNLFGFFIFCLFIQDFLEEIIFIYFFEFYIFFYLWLKIFLFICFFVGLLAL